MVFYGGERLTGVNTGPTTVPLIVDTDFSGKTWDEFQGSAALTAMLPGWVSRESVVDYLHRLATEIEAGRVDVTAPYPTLSR